MAQVSLSLINIHGYIIEGVNSEFSSDLPVTFGMPFLKKMHQNYNKAENSVAKSFLGWRTIKSGLQT